MLWKKAHHILVCLCLVHLQTSLAQFKVISGSSTHHHASHPLTQKIQRTRSLQPNSNVTYVQMRPLVNQLPGFDGSGEVASKPRGFSSAPSVGKALHDKYGTAKRARAKQSKVIKLNILDSTSPIRQSRIKITKKRVGKLQENALRINNELLASGSGKGYQSIIRIKPTNYTNYPSPPSAMRPKPTKVPMLEVLEPIVSETSHKSRSNSIPSDQQFTEKLLIKRLKLRPYKTKCRCEKIWNCTKMQMSIARCPADTFMCCG